MSTEADGEPGLLSPSGTNAMILQSVFISFSREPGLTDAEIIAISSMIRLLISIPYAGFNSLKSFFPVGVNMRLGK